MRHALAGTTSRRRSISATRRRPAHQIDQHDIGASTGKLHRRSGVDGLGRR